MIDLERKRDAEVPKIKRHKIQALGEQSPGHATPKDQNPIELRNVLMREGITLGESPM